MIDKQPLSRSLIILGLFFLCLIGLLACQSKTQALPLETDPPVNQAEQIPPEQNAPEQNAPEQPSSSESQTEPDSPTTAGGESNTSAEITEDKSDPAVIEAGWRTSPHADTFVLDAAGQNNTCARCHAPINWMPAMEDLPESCYACKFELEAPPPLIPESEWVDIPCNVCHLVDKKDNILPEYAWLEIAPLGEYTKVSSPSELCLKCHAPVDIPGHASVIVGGAHADYECIRCHSEHDTTASCDAAGCHPDVIEPATLIPGHDADHQAVSCVACHDGSGLEVGPDEESGIWLTFAAGPSPDGGDRFAFTSHNVVLDASCDRCHFVDNPWGLSGSVANP